MQSCVIIHGMAGERIPSGRRPFEDPWAVRHTKMVRIKLGNVTIIANPRHNSLNSLKQPQNADGQEKGKQNS